MKLISNLADIDKKAVQQAGISADALMENAGRAVAEAILYHGGKRTQGVILCGPGNNGGDGFVCARYLYQGGITKLTVIHTSTGYKREALRHFERLMQLPVEMINAEQQIKIAISRLKQADFVVDALFGSGLSREVQGVEKQLIDAANAHREQSDCLVWAVDLPSGIDSATGQVLGAAVQADTTITLAAAKPGLYLQPGKAYADDVQIAEIGIPNTLIDEDESPICLITKELAKTWLPERKPDSHKYDYGHVLVLAGSQKMPGAAALCSEAAMNAGVGLVTLAAPETVFRQISCIPEIMRLPFPEMLHLTEDALDKLIEPGLQAGKYNTIVLGPGLGQEPETVKAVIRLLKFLKKASQAVVVDADALNALAAHSITLNERFILTPHVGEAARLLKRESQEVRRDLLESARQLQTKYHAQVVLKSASTVVADSRGLLWISSAGNPGMATAGSGDVLAGILSAQVAQACAQNRPLEAAVPFAVYLHGLAGDEAAANVTPYALRASDITYHLPDAFRRLMNHRAHQEF